MYLPARPCAGPGLKARPGSYRSRPPRRRRHIRAISAIRVAPANEKLAVARNRIIGRQGPPAAFPAAMARLIGLEAARHQAKAQSARHRHHIGLLVDQPAHDLGPLRCRVRHERRALGGRESHSIRSDICRERPPTPASTAAGDPSEFLGQRVPARCRWGCALWAQLIQPGSLTL